MPGGNKAGPVRAALAADLNQVSPGLRRTLTWDRGREMAEHAVLTAQTGCQVYDQQTLDAIAAPLNGRPRAIHGGRTPAEVYAQLPTGDTPLLTDGGALIT